MAENKKSFILYQDQRTQFDKLPDEVAGKLIKHIFAYISDEDPATDDLLLEIAFEPIKQALKRDLKTWENFKKKQAENGKLGGRPKKNEGLEEKPNNPSLLSESQKSLNASATVNANVTATPRDQVVECLRRAAPVSISNEQVEQEADELLKQYSGKKIKRLQALCNTWMQNVQEAVVIPINNQDKPLSSFI